ncbi:MAG: response regulator [Candidatus Cloacimonadota bacterium]|nr:MAG: response regulator [Candidatus Cloacimonadota bacterium]
MEKVMVVDDDEGIRCLYEQVLTDEGYKVILASDGLEAVEIFKNIKPDIVVLDIRMPGMDGIELLGKVLDMDRKLPVIINSAYSMYKNNFLTWMADAYVIKSSDLTELKLKIRELLEAKKKKNTESN